MFSWLKKKFCRHEYKIISETPVIYQRWEANWSVRDCADYYGIGKFIPVKVIEIKKKCEKCGYKYEDYKEV